ncbi:MAG: hypothetical protein AB7O26_21080, partial [Planctomycetaceae bacterium]
MTLRFLRSIGFGSALALTAVVASPLVAAEKFAKGDTAPVSVYTYATPDGNASFAIAVKATETPAGSAHDHIVLVDTSASQAGDYRTQSLAVAKSLLSELPTGDRVLFMAVDVAVTRLNKGFVSPTSEEAKAAIAKLEDRAPLGATNLVGALRDAISPVQNGRPASIVYIGDGMSVAGLVQKPEMRELVA